MSGRYFNRQGEPLTLEEYAAAMSYDWNDPRSQQAVERFEDEQHLVSTVWLGLNHEWHGGPPLIFETMIFCRHKPACELDDEQWRYSTEAAAREGHAHAVGLVGG